ncbi:MAG: hypothetical protein AAF957_22705 [Planctomycetota bacterium]
MIGLDAAAAAAGLVGILFWVLLWVLLWVLAAGRSWLVRWGATDAERRAAMPGDALFPAAPSSVTHAISIDAPPDDVWPWIVQIGQGRGGFYSYAALENLLGARMRNADAIEPDLQSLAVGDAIPIHPRLDPFFVDAIDAGRSLVLRGDAGAVAGTSWAFSLAPSGERGTRLVARMRIHRGGEGAPGRAVSLLWSVLVLEPGHSIMERRMLLGVAVRAERR